MKVITTIALSVVVSYALLLIVLATAIVIARPGGGSLREAMRLLPDVLRLVGRLATDRSVARGPRIALWLLASYLATPLDLVPDFVPVIGYADDVLLAGLVLRWVVRRSGPDPIRTHWPGTQDGLNAVGRLVGADLANAPDPSISRP